MKCEGTIFNINSKKFICTGMGSMIIEGDTSKAYRCKCVDAQKVNLDTKTFWIRYINQRIKYAPKELKEKELNIMNKLTSKGSYWINGDYQDIMIDFMLKRQNQINFAWGSNIEYTQNKLGELISNLGGDYCCDSDDYVFFPRGWIPDNNHIAICYGAQDISPGAFKFLDKFFAKKKFILVSTSNKSLQWYLKENSIESTSLTQLNA